MAPPTLLNDREVRNSRHAFHETRHLYTVLAERAKVNPVFLPRNLRRIDKISLQANAPPVLYRSGERGVQWESQVSNLRCLWCKDHFFTFCDADELLHHLTTCHGTLNYTLDNFENNIDPRCPLVISMTLLRATHAVGQKREDLLFRKFTFETTLVNKRQRRTVPRHGCARNNIIDRLILDHFDPKKPRHQPPLTSTASKKPPLNGVTDLKLGSESCDANFYVEPPFENGFDPLRSREFSEDSRDSDVARAVSRHVGKRSDCSEDTAHGSVIVDKNAMTNTLHLMTVKAADDDRSRRPMPGRPPTGRQKVRCLSKVAFPSVEEGIRHGRLFHSVSQTPYRLEALEMEDSDVEDMAEKEWRFRLRRDEIIEYVDTLPAESLFMNLWNQFVGMECNLDSDGQMSGACDAFVKKYHRILKKMKLEIAYVHHLSEMSRMGLVDSDDVYSCIQQMRSLETASAEDEVLPRFLFAQQMLQTQARKDAAGKRLTH